MSLVKAADLITVFLLLWRNYKMHDFLGQGYEETENYLQIITSNANYAVLLCLLLIIATKEAHQSIINYNNAWDTHSFGSHSV